MLRYNQPVTCVCTVPGRIETAVPNTHKPLRHCPSAPPGADPPCPLTFLTPYASTKTAINTHSCRVRRKRQRLT
jgi:hypothetical protein